MTNVFRRLRNRAQSSSSSSADQADTTGPSTASHPHGLQRTVSSSSAKRSQRYEEPSPRYLLVISDTADFSPHVIHRFQAEGFDVIYLPFVGCGDVEKDRKALENEVHLKEDELETGERYAIVAYHRPAYLLLASHHMTQSTTNPFPRLCALIAYYPLPSTDQFSYRQKDNCSPPGCSDTGTIFEAGPKATYLPIQIHQPGPRVQPCALWPWISLSASEGDVTYKKRHRCHVYSYAGSRVGFAEHTSDNPDQVEDDDTEDEISSQLAWSRVMGCLRRSFSVGSHWAVVDIETVWEEYWDRVWGELENGEENDENHESVYESAVDILVRHGHYGELGCPAGKSCVKCVPTMAGGSTLSSLRDFFAHTFVPNGPDGQKVRLLSRTVGSDRIVDEMMFSCRHTAEISWLLPDVSPTDRDIKVVIVVVAGFCAGKITHQNLYWDQASVLAQVGLIDHGLLPLAKSGN